MPRYIDADQIVYWIRHTSRDGLEDDVRRVAFKDAIERIPTADVQEIKHGHWIGQPISGYADCRCSVCGAVCHVHACAGIPTQRYCYRCGAKMMEEENETLD